MAKTEEILKLWKTRKEENFSTVVKVLQEKGFSVRTKGSHNIFSHPALQAAYEKDPVTLEDFGPDGEMCVPTVSGRKVKSCYLKRALSAFRIIEEEEQNGS